MPVCIAGGVVDAAVVDHDNVAKTVVLDVDEDAADAGGFVQRGDDNQAGALRQGSDGVIGADGGIECA